MSQKLGYLSYSTFRNMIKNKANLSKSYSQRFNDVNIQMISKSLQDQIFCGTSDKLNESPDLELEVARSITHLKKVGLWENNPAFVEDVDLEVPKFIGKNLSSHFWKIGVKQSDYFKKLVNTFIKGETPKLPNQFSFNEGWTVYHENGDFDKIDFPKCPILVFDTEVCVVEGRQPTLACAVSDTNWYTWCSGRLINENVPVSFDLKSLISFGPQIKKCKKIIVGHNVSYDRLAIKEEYFIDSSLKFLDTMSLHIAVSGLVDDQRKILFKNKNEETKIRLPWMNVGCPNNLKDVFKFYCKEEIVKETRDIFVKGTLNDIRENFQMLMHYCAQDVITTKKVLIQLFPLFLKRFSHPVILSGMLEMGKSYLPVNDNWNKYIKSSEEKYEFVSLSLSSQISDIALDTLKLFENNDYLNDIWLWDLDWNLPKAKVKILPNHPNWYRKLYMRTKDRCEYGNLQRLSTSLKVVPKLLKLTWNGYPLHYDNNNGWGYLKYSKSVLNYDNISDSNVVFPIEEFKAFVESVEHNKSDEEELPGINIGIPNVLFHRLPHKNGKDYKVGNPLSKDFLVKLEKNILGSNITSISEELLKKTKAISYWKNNRDRITSQKVVYLNENNLPKTVTNSDDYDNKKHYGAILPQVVAAGTITRRAVEGTWMTASNAYSDRIGSELKAMIVAPPGYTFVGADVDSQELWIASVLSDSYGTGIHGSTPVSWMTLQGSKSDGTDMHSKTAQTAGISRDNAKILNYGRIYGAGLKFMQRLLKQYNPELTEKEARFRAFRLFATTKGEKGHYVTDLGYALAKQMFGSGYEDVPLTRKQVNELMREAALKLDFHGEKSEFIDLEDVLWVGGTESYMFNCLESIAKMDWPRTPVLGAQITRALEPWCVDDQFMPSRINWVVQSSAVDYLHLMLVCMRWLFEEYDIDGRFAISIHDEVRYLVKHEDRYRAALALHITNLLVRSFISIRLGINDLPQSVAFFSGVDIDKVLRKEPHMECVTPSNPEGLGKGYGIEPGESLNIYQVIEKTKGSLNKVIDDDVMMTRTRSI